MTTATSERLRRAADWTFRDRTNGRITIAQSPNLSIGLFLVLIALAWAAQWMAGAAAPYAGWLRIAAHLVLVWWALDEIVRGVNPWRRFLGAAALVGLAALYLVP